MYKHEANTTQPKDCEFTNLLTYVKSINTLFMLLSKEEREMI
jgi:hypothetical protein